MQVVSLPTAQQKSITGKQACRPQNKLPFPNSTKQAGPFTTPNDTNAESQRTQLTDYTKAIPALQEADNGRGIGGIISVSSIENRWNFNGLLTDNCTAESLRGMAADAIGAKRALVHILRLVTGVAIGWQLGARYVLGLVAIIATNAGVGAIQRIMPIPAMIKSHTLPAQGAVAVFTSLRKTALMRVVFRVAFFAGCGGAFVNRRGVATFAGRNLVQSNQGIGRQAMIKAHIPFPGGSVVAITTVIAQRCFVHILRLVTGHAVH